MTRRGRPGGISTVLRALVVAVVAVAGLALTAAPAAAHNVLTGTTPGDGQRVGRTPTSVVLTFDEPAVALGTQLVVTGPTGEVQRGAPRLVDNTVTQDLEGGAPAGRYGVSWRVTSADGHPVSGTFSFTSTAAGLGTPSAASSAGATSSTAGAPVPRRGAPTGWAWLVLVVLIVSVVGITQRGARLGRTRPPDRPDPRR